jgi:hypothetical protein
MNMNRSTLLRYLTPGMIVALVLGFSLVVPAAANDDHNKQCGYGYGYGHTDNESQQGENHESQQAEMNDEPCGEVEGDEDGNHGAEKAEKADDSGVQAGSVAVHSQGGGGGHDTGESKEKGGGDD